MTSRTNIYGTEIHYIVWAIHVGHIQSRVLCKRFRTTFDFYRRNLLCIFANVEIRNLYHNSDEWYFGYSEVCCLIIVKIFCEASFSKVYDLGLIYMYSWYFMCSRWSVSFAKGIVCKDFINTYLWPHIDAKIIYSWIKGVLQFTAF